MVFSTRHGGFLLLSELICTETIFFKVPTLICGSYYFATMITFLKFSYGFSMCPKSVFQVVTITRIYLDSFESVYLSSGDYF